MKYWLAVGALTATCSAATGYWWDRDHALWQSPSPKTPDVSAVHLLPAPVTASTTTALERPVMWASRRPPPPPRVASPADRLLDELNRSRLLAVVQSGTQQIAILRTADGRLIKHSNQGQQIRLESFDNIQATFVTEDGQRTIRPLERQRQR